MSCFLDTGLGNLWEVPMEGSHIIIIIIVIVAEVVIISIVSMRSDTAVLFNTDLFMPKFKMFAFCYSLVLTNV
jgi:hypothetical protein